MKQSQKRQPGRPAKKAAAKKSSSTSQQSSSTSAQSTATNSLQEFFLAQLQETHYAEEAILKALAELKQAATTEELEDAFDQHIRQTERHVKRLEKIFKAFGQEASGKQCHAIDGLIKDAQLLIQSTPEDSMLRDAALIIAAQKVEHLEIASYGSLAQLAITMEKYRVAEVLEKTLAEEEETDQLLTQIAESYINIEAEQEPEGEEEEEQEEATAG